MIDLIGAYRIYFVASALGAHSNFSPKGFRQKDFRFLLGLFLNWMDPTTKGVEESVHNTQIARYLDGLARSGHAQKQGAGRSTRYVLTRGGILELVEQLVRSPETAPFEQFFFVRFFVKVYGKRLMDLLAQKENRLPRAFQLEVESLLDLQELRHRQIQRVKLEIRKLEERVRETKGAAKLSRDLHAKGKPVEEIAASVEQLFPYDLNNVKPMRELFGEVPPALRLWELTEGNDGREGELWRPLKAHLEAYLQLLTHS